MPASGHSRFAAAGLALRSLFWTLAFPGVVAGFVPWRWFGLGFVDLDPGNALHWAGLLGVVSGGIVLGVCVREFARTGRGTLSPVDPPRSLVVRGPYRHVRNPMYLGVSLILTGELLLAPSTAFLVYGLIWFAAVNLFVVGYEEPTLRRRFGPEYERYTRAVGRWLPRVRPYGRSS